MSWTVSYGGKEVKISVAPEMTLTSLIKNSMEKLGLQESNDFYYVLQPSGGKTLDSSLTVRMVGGNVSNGFKVNLVRIGRNLNGIKSKTAFKTYILILM